MMRSMDSKIEQLNAKIAHMEKTRYKDRSDSWGPLSQGDFRLETIDKRLQSLEATSAELNQVKQVALEMAPRQSNLKKERHDGARYEV